MSTFTLISGRLAAETPRTIDPLGALKREWVLWRARRALARLDDLALQDIGLARSEIDDAVRYGRRG